MTNPLLTVMVVDDEEMVRLNLETFLGDAGFDLISVESGEDAEKILQETKVHVGIIDMRLPDMDGQTLILSANKINPDMQFIIHTGSLDYILPQQLSDIGITASQICHKPISDMDALIEKVHELAETPLTAK